MGGKRENRCLSVGAGVVFIAAGMAAAGLVGADYDYKGVVLIAALYLLRGNRKSQCIFAPLLFLGSFCWMCLWGFVRELRLPHPSALSFSVFFPSFSCMPIMERDI